MTMRRLPEKQLYKQKCLELLKGALDIRNRRTLEGILSNIGKTGIIPREKSTFVELWHSGF